MVGIKVLIISSSPRREGNTDYIAKLAVDEVLRCGAEPIVVRVYDYRIEPCRGCRACLREGCCVIDDDFTNVLAGKLMEADAIIIVSPVFFNSIPSQLKAFIDRTWCLRGKLRDKVGGVIVVGRRYGHELAICTLHSFMLKHEMILGMRGVAIYGFEVGEAAKDTQGLEDARKLARRVVKLAEIVKRGIKIM